MHLTDLDVLARSVKVESTSGSVVVAVASHVHASVLEDWGVVAPRRLWQVDLKHR